MLLLEQLTPGVTAYNVPRVYTVAGSLDADVLRRAFEVVVARHEPLRTTIEVVDGFPVQRVADRASIDVRVFDLSDETEADSKAEAIVDELAWAPFDLAHDLMLRAALVRVAPAEERLLVVCHHLVSDYASAPILMSELAESYDAIAAGREPRLPGPPDRLRRLRPLATRSSPGADARDEHRVLAGATQGAPERIDLPADRPPPAAKTYAGGQMTSDVDARTVEGLRTLARSNGVSVFVVLLAAVKTLLHRYTLADDVVVGSPATGRHYEETMPLIGYFSNTLVLRTSLSGDPTFRELVGRVQ